MELVYDGTFNGLMTSLQHALQNGQEKARIRRESYETISLFNDEVLISTQAKTVSEFMIDLHEVGGRAFVRDIMWLFLSDISGFEDLMMKYVALAISINKNPSTQLQQTIVNKVQKTIQKTCFEVHRFEGLLRFEQLDDGHLWASFEPDHNISGVLAPHFKRRLPNEKFVICDVRRGIGVVYDGKDLQEILFDSQILHTIRTYGTLLKSPDKYEQLWRQYFHKIAIQPRRNLKLQQSFMPKKYWKYLTEKKHDN